MRIKHVCQNLINENFYNGLFYKSKHWFRYLNHWNVKKMEIRFCWLFPILWKSDALFWSCQASPLVLLITVVLEWRRAWSINGMILTGENRTSKREKNYQHLLEYHKPHIECLGIELRPLNWETIGSTSDTMIRL